MQRTTGHVYVVERQNGRQWYAKWRDAHGQHQKRLGPAWVKKTTMTTARGAPVWRTADGPKPTPEHLTPVDAELLLRELLVNTPDPTTLEGTRTFGEAAEAWYENGRLKRGLKRSTLRDYRLTLDLYVLPDLADVPLVKLDRARLERWHDRFPYGRTAEKTLMLARAICSFAVRREWIDRNPTLALERHTVNYSGDYDFYSLEEVHALARGAADTQDATLFLVAAMTGLRRGELLALTWRDVDFAQRAIRVRRNLSYGELTTPKSGRIRVVPLITPPARELARLAERGRFTGREDFVFGSPLGGTADGSALRRRYARAVKRAGLRHLPFHSLRHHFGSMAVTRASLVQVQAWMGHAHVQTTARYLHHASQARDAELLEQAFEPQEIPDLGQSSGSSTPPSADWGD